MAARDKPHRPSCAGLIAPSCPAAIERACISRPDPPAAAERAKISGPGSLFSTGCRGRRDRGNKRMGLVGPRAAPSPPSGAKSREHALGGGLERLPERDLEV